MCVCVCADTWPSPEPPVERNYPKVAVKITRRFSKRCSSLILSDFLFEHIRVSFSASSRFVRNEGRSEGAGSIRVFPSGGRVGFVAAKLYWPRGNG